MGVNGTMHVTHLEGGQAHRNGDKQVMWKYMGLEAIQLIFAIFPLCDFGGYHELFNSHLHVENGDSNTHLQVLLESNEGKEWSKGAE